MKALSKREKGKETEMRERQREREREEKKKREREKGNPVISIHNFHFPYTLTEQM